MRTVRDVLSTRRFRGGRTKPLALATAVIAAAGLAVVPTAASASSAPAGPGLRPASAARHGALPASSLSPLYTATGKVTLWSAGLGEDTGSGTIPIKKPSSTATVLKAFLFAASTGFNPYEPAPGDIGVNGTPITFDPAHDIASQIGSTNNVADVTSLIASIVDPATPGITNVTVTEAFPGNVDGEGLAVVFSDSSLTVNNTIILMYGAQNPNGDTFHINLASAIDKTDPNLFLRMGLGISFSYDQQGAADQFSTINVNNNLLSSSAGGQDDCNHLDPANGDYCGNGSLFTFGGPNHGAAHNPPDPTANSGGCVPDTTPVCDGEYYDLMPFVNTGDTSIKVDTQNPSNDDNIFYASLELGDVAAVANEGILLTPVSGTDAVGSNHTLTGHVQDSSGNPIASTSVTFSVVSGPNAGLTHTSSTNASGDATWTYSSAVAGTDTIQATFVDNTSATITSNQVTETWTSGGGVVTPTINTTPSGSTNVGGSVSDTATLTNGNNPTGSVSFSLFGPGDTQCTTPLTTVSGGVNASGVATSPAVTVNQAGTYLWTAMYSGDANNTSVSSPCGSESVVVKAPPPPSSITGGTVITIGGPAVATLQSHGCGTLMASVANGATVFTGVHNEIRISLKINGYMMQPNGAYRLSFAGAVTLTNSCYTITFDAFRLSNFGLGVPVTTFNVKAISHSSGRQLAGTLDLSGATVTVTGSKTRVEKMDLFLSAGGAELLNTLATGTPNGPFSPGEKVGFAKTTVVFH